MTELKDLVLQLAKDPEDPDANFNLAYAYHEKGHTASAVSYYLRAAERGPDLLAYEALIRCHYCFDNQQQRDFTAKHVLKQAQVILPKRVEAYYLLARFHISKSEWAEAYVQLKLAKEFCDFTSREREPLKTIVGYKNDIHFNIDLASACWEWDKNQEAREILKSLMADEVFNNADEKDKQFIKEAIDKVGINSEEQVYKTYTKDKVLVFPFKGSDEIEINNSQCYQDLFVLYMTGGKKEGTFLEVGCGPAFHGSNTALLEQKYDWKGISIDNEPKYAFEHKNERKSQTIFDNALVIDYDKLIKEHLPDSKIIDYLQLDLEPANNTFECLLQIPFENYKFGVITYEHDHYIDFTKSYKKKSRRYLTMMGYELVVGDVSPDGSSTFEDWWVHPDLVDRDLIERIKHTNGIVNIEEYMTK